MQDFFQFQNFFCEAKIDFVLWHFGVKRSKAKISVMFQLNAEEFSMLQGQTTNIQTTSSAYIAGGNWGILIYVPLMSTLREC